MNNEEKAYWFDKILSEGFDIFQRDDGVWVVGGEYEGQGCYAEEGEGVTIQAAYEAYKKANKPQTLTLGKQTSKFLGPADKPSADAWGGGIS
jgi:hypothetical protein